MLKQTDIHPHWREYKVVPPPDNNPLSIRQGVVVGWTMAGPKK